jgi:hypothetical protein
MQRHALHTVGGQHSSAANYSRSHALGSSAVDSQDIMSSNYQATGI